MIKVSIMNPLVDHHGKNNKPSVQLCENTYNSKHGDFETCMCFQKNGEVKNGAACDFVYTNISLVANSW